MLKLNFRVYNMGFYWGFLVMFPNAHIINLNTKSLKIPFGGVSKIL